MGMADVSPLPIRGEVVVDARGGARALRVSWHPEQGVVVLSVWRGNTCAATVQVDPRRFRTWSTSWCRAWRPRPRPRTRSRTPADHVGGAIRTACKYPLPGAPAAPYSSLLARPLPAPSSLPPPGSGSACTTVSSDTARVSTT